MKQKSSSKKSVRSINKKTRRSISRPSIFGRFDKKLGIAIIFILFFGGLGVFLQFTSQAAVPSIVCPLDNTKLPYKTQSGQEFGASRDNGKRKHHGIDFAASQGGGGSRGATIRAVANSTVIKAGAGGAGEGTVVYIKTSDNIIYRYLHLESVEKGIAVNKQVSAGTPIGKVGNTGGDYPVHLHFEYRPGDSPQNPLPLINNCRKFSGASPNTCPHRPPANGSRGTHVLRLGQELKKGEYLISQDKKNWLIMQTDGNLVLWNYCGPDWNPATNKTNAFKLVFQREDGNLVLRNERGNYHYWFSDTQGKGAAMLAILNSSAQEHGKIVIYKGDEQTPIWSSKPNDTRLHYGGVRATNDPGAGY